MCQLVLVHQKCLIIKLPLKALNLVKAWMRYNMQKKKRILYSPFLECVSVWVSLRMFVSVCPPLLFHCEWLYWRTLQCVFIMHIYVCVSEECAADEKWIVACSIVGCCSFCCLSLFVEWLKHCLVGVPSGTIPYQSCSTSPPYNEEKVHVCVIMCVCLSVS